MPMLIASHRPQEGHPRIKRPVLSGAVMATLVTASSLATAAYAVGNEAPEISFASLVAAMVNREELARFPLPEFRRRDQSSYDRLSTSPDEAKTWFANRDAGNFIRVEEHAGRKEWVLLDHAGPGAIVRSWMADPRLVPGPKKGEVRTILRVYLDGAEEPVLAGHVHDLFNGTLLAPYPFGHTSLSSAVSFLPIPYARSCKITTDAPPMYYIFDYLEYPGGTPVKSFTKQNLASARELVEHVGKTLSHPPDVAASRRVALKQQMGAQGEARVDLPKGGGAVRTLALKLKPRDSPQVTRSLVLKIEFDGQQTIWCPVGDFFGTGVGINPFQDWYRSVDQDGGMTCRWVMPYRKSGRITLVNLGTDPAEAQLEATVGDWTWDDRSMYFHATWRREFPIKTMPRSDWNYVTLEGRGVYVGDTLTVWNPVPQWWGEGDAKIYVDGEKFPSLFGTGTEDYYGYAWGGRNRGFYQHPFHAQVLVGPYNAINPGAPSAVQATQGYSTETRTRALDAMPFGRSLRVDMEIWHWKECEMDYAVATYWYGLPGTSANHAPMPEEAAQPVHD